MNEVFVGRCWVRCNSMLYGCDVTELCSVHGKVGTGPEGTCLEGVGGGWQVPVDR